MIDMKRAPANPNWVDAETAAHMLGIGRTTLFRLRKQGKIKAANDNGLLQRPQVLYFDKDEVERVRKEAQSN